MITSRTTRFSAFSLFSQGILSAGIVLIMLSGCKSDQSQDQGDTFVPPPPPPPFVGYFEADAGSEDLAGPLLSLNLMADKGAELVTDSMNYKPERVEIGDWSKIGENKLEITLAGVSYSSERTIHLELIGENLVGSEEGMDVVFQPADQVVGRIRELVMWVGADKMPCGGDSKEQCFRVSYGDSKSPGPFENFYDPIEGFLWHPGTAYKIKVKETYTGDSELDASSVKYELVEILFQKVME